MDFNDIGNTSIYNFNRQHNIFLAQDGENINELIYSISKNYGNLFCSECVKEGWKGFEETEIVLMACIRNNNCIISNMQVGCWKHGPKYIDYPLANWYIGTYLILCCQNDLLNFGVTLISVEDMTEKQHNKSGFYESVGFTETIYDEATKEKVISEEIVKNDWKIFNDKVFRKIKIGSPSNCIWNKSYFL